MSLFGWRWTRAYYCINKLPRQVKEQNLENKFQINNLCKERIMVYIAYCLTRLVVRRENGEMESELLQMKSRDNDKNSLLVLGKV